MHPRQRLSAAGVAAHNLFDVRGPCPCGRMRRVVPACIYCGQGGFDPERCTQRCVVSATVRLENARSRILATWQPGNGKVPLPEGPGG